MMENIPIESLLGFPVELVALFVICWTVLEIVKVIANRKNETIEIKKPKQDEQSSDK